MEIGEVNPLNTIHGLAIETHTTTKTLNQHTNPKLIFKNITSNKRYKKILMIPLFNLSRHDGDFLIAYLFMC